MTNTNKVDFAHMLERRRFSVGQWLESEQIGSMTEFEAWRFAHAAEYVFNEKFLKEIESILTTKSDDTWEKRRVEDLVNHMETVIPQDTTPTKNAFVELSHQSLAKKNKKDPVNNPPKED